MYECSSSVAITCYIIKSKKPFVKDLFGHRGFGIDHNRPGTAGDFLFYLETMDFDLRHVKLHSAKFSPDSDGAANALGQFKRRPTFHQSKRQA